MQPSRLFWADNLKGFLILLVVLGHVIQLSCDNFDELHLFNYIYSFHMPLFMMISGFCSYKPNNHNGSLFNKTKRRASQLLLPYLFWTILSCLLSGKSIWRGLVVSPSYWFLILLFIISVLFLSCQWLANNVKNKSEPIIIVFTVVLFVTIGLIKPNFLSLGILHVHFFFYATGWYLHKYEIQLLHHWMVVPFGLFAIVLGWFYHRNASPSFFSYAPPVFYFMLSGISGSIFFITLFRGLMKKQISILCHIGRVTLGIYVIHPIIWMLGVLCLDKWVEWSKSVLGLVLLFTIISIISILLSAVMEKTKFSRILIGLK